MIEFTKAFKASDGKVYPSLEEALIAELTPLVQNLMPSSTSTATDAASTVAAGLVNERKRIIDILTTTESSRPRARKANGGTKKRKPSTGNTSETSPA